MNLATIEFFEVAVHQWAEDRGIFEQSSPEAQSFKTLEEVGEMREALFAEDREGVKDAIGDIMVTLIIQSKMHGLTLGECLAHAYAEIRDRKGQMVNGIFVKEIV